MSFHPLTLQSKLMWRLARISIHCAIRFPPWWQCPTCIWPCQSPTCETLCSVYDNGHAHRCSVRRHEKLLMTAFILSHNRHNNPHCISYQHKLSKLHSQATTTEHHHITVQPLYLDYSYPHSQVPELCDHAACIRCSGDPVYSARKYFSSTPPEANQKFLEANSWRQGSL